MDGRLRPEEGDDTDAAAAEHPGPRTRGRRAPMTPGERRVEAPPAAMADETELVADLLRGDEAAFVRLVQRLHPSMVRVALLYTRDRAVAEEVVQEAWLGVLQQLDRFEGRASLKTWILRIVANVAKTRGARERRTVPFSALLERDADTGPAVAPERFLEPGHHWAGGWSVPPQSWRDVPEERLLSLETRALIERAIDRLPPAQQAVISLRDVEGWSAAEVCDLLGVSEGNQRVLLHRARSRVRGALEDYLEKARTAT